MIRIYSKRSYTLSLYVLIIILISVGLFLSCDYQREEVKLRVSFTRSGDIFTMDEDGNDQIQLTFLGSNDFSSWSPDGDKIVFQSNRDGNDEIYIMDADGKKQVQLTSTTSPSFSRYPTFFPDGEHIVYVEFSSSNYYFKIINLNGNLIKQLSASGSPLGVTVSPDGKHLADTYGAGWIRITSVDSGVQTMITNPSYYSPAWNSDGSAIIVRDSLNNISVIYPRLTPLIVPVVIYPFGAEVTGVSLSPDSETIIFAKTAGIPDNTDGIYSVSINGTGLKQLTVSQDLAYPDSNPCFQFKPK